MSMVSVTIQLPEDVFLAIQSAGLDKERIKEELQESAAVNLFRKGVLSLGKASKFAGMCIADFRELLVKSGLPIVDYSLEDYEEDMEAVKEVEEMLR